jgi:surface antigen
MRNAQMTLEIARTGQTWTWRNPDTGHSGTLTSSQTYRAASGRYCREYQHVIVSGASAGSPAGPRAGSPTARISRPYPSNEDEGGD